MCIICVSMTMPCILMLAPTCSAVGRAHVLRRRTQIRCSVRCSLASVPNAFIIIYLNIQSSPHVRLCLCASRTHSLPLAHTQHKHYCQHNKHDNIARTSNTNPEPWSSKPVRIVVSRWSHSNRVTTSACLVPSIASNSASNGQTITTSFVCSASKTTSSSCVNLNKDRMRSARKHRR